MGHCFGMASVSEASLVARLKAAPGVAWRKHNDRYQTGMPDLSWCVTKTRVSGFAEIKDVSEVSVTSSNGFRLGLRKQQGPYMDALVRDGWRVALIVGLARGSVGVLREAPGQQARFTTLGKARWTMEQLLEMGMHHLKSATQIRTALY
jgi:hypothetical protein